MKKIAYLTAAAILSGAVFLNATAADLASDTQKTTENQTISIDQNSNAPSSLQCGYFKLKQSGQKIFSSEIHSVKASSEEDLVQKTEEWMRNFTKTSGHEACANICKSPEGEFSAIFTTSHSQIGCAVSRDRCLDGFSPAGRTIHSHPALPLSNSIVLSKTDQLFFKPEAAVTQLFKNVCGLIPEHSQKKTGRPDQVIL